MAANGLVTNGSSAPTDADAAAAAAAANDNHDTNSTVDASRQRSTLPPHYNSFPRYHHAIHQPGPPPHASSSSSSSSGGGKQIPPAAAATARVLGPDLLRGLLMALMAMDHLGLALRPWAHGLGNGPERDGEPVTRWNRPAAYVVRSLTHLCAPGFALLLGMGVAYLGRARRRRGKGWSAGRLLRYFALRMAVLTLVMIAQSLVITAGQVWFLNIVLFALAVDYFLAGAVWLALDETEHRLTGLLTRMLLPLRKQHTEQNVDVVAAARCAHDSEADAEQQPLLLAGQQRPQVSAADAKAARVSWHVHNAILLLLSVVTIFWNIWLSRDQGQCAAAARVPDTALVVGTGGWPESEPDRYWWLHLWFWETSAPGVLSAFPPLAWLSFALGGVLYGRVMIHDHHHPQRSTRRLLGHLLAGLALAVVFLLTRLLHIGNLSEHCLQTPENRAHHPSRNQYLASPAAFFYTIKYPPDVAFWALTLSANFFLLAGLGRVPAAFAKKWLVVLLDFGTASLFFYVVHMPVVFLTGWAMCALFGHETDQEGPPTGLVSGKSIDNVFGFFAVWTLCLLIMWPLCRWYGRFKFGKPADSLWRIF